MAEANYRLNEVETIQEWVQRKLGIKRNRNLARSMDIDMSINENKYSLKYVVRLLKEKYPGGRVFFYFSDRDDYVALSSNGHLNVRGGEEDMFRAWGSSEFRNLKPQSLFQELEKELIKIIVVPASNRENYSFDSYNDLISWLTFQADENEFKMDQAL